MQADTTDVLIGRHTVLRTSSYIIALAAIVAAPSMTAQAEMLALRCEGTRITTEIKDLGIGELSPGFRDLGVGEEDKGTKDARTEERASTDVIVTDQEVYAFGTEFETGYRNDAFIRFGRTANNPAIPALISTVSLRASSPPTNQSTPGRS